MIEALLTLFVTTELFRRIDPSLGDRIEAAVNQILKV